MSLSLFYFIVKSENWYDLQRYGRCRCATNETFTWSMKKAASFKHTHIHNMQLNWLHNSYEPNPNPTISCRDNLYIYIYIYIYIYLILCICLSFKFGLIFKTLSRHAYESYLELQILFVIWHAECTVLTARLTLVPSKANLAIAAHLICEN